MDLPIFQYSPLSSPSIFRLIELSSLEKVSGPDNNANECSTTTGTHVLRCRIIETNISSPVPYDALSYFWGSGPRDHRMLIENSDGSLAKIMTTKSLDIALRTLQHTAVKGPIFVDQLCVNQNDDTEKSIQVQLMGEIYGKCTRCLAWLGPATIQSNTFMDLITSTSVNPLFSLKQVLNGPGPSDLWAASQIQIDELFDREFEGDHYKFFQYVVTYKSQIPLDLFTDILGRDWFRRIWIIQEAALPNTLIFYCGTRSCCADCFGAVLGSTTLFLVAQVFFSLRAVGLEEVNSFLVAAYNALQVLATRDRNNESELDDFTLFYLVQFFNIPIDKNNIRLGATDPRDRIYALRGMARKDDIVMQRFFVTYSETVESVYTEFAAQVFQQNPDILLFAQYSDKFDLPSWVPDWSAHPKPPAGYLGGKPKFSAGGTLREAKSHVDSKILCVSGHKIDVITRIGNSCMEDRRYEFWEDESILPFLLEVSLFCDLASSDPNSFRDISLAGRDRSRWLLSTGGLGLRADNLHYNAAEYLMGTTRHGKPDLGHFYEATVRRLTEGIRLRKSRIQALDTCYFYLADLVSSYLLNTFDLVRNFAFQPLSTVGALYEFGYMSIQYILFLVSFRSGRKAEDHLSKDWEGTLHYQMALANNTERRCYTTRHGFIGLGPRRLEIGDIVVIVFGCSTPLILRPSIAESSGKASDHYSLIGEAYCDGIMDGEFFKNKPEGNVERFQIV